MHWIELFVIFLQWLFAFQIGDASSNLGHDNLRITHNASIATVNAPHLKRNLLVLYRLFGPTSEEYVYVAGKNQIYQFDAGDLKLSALRTTGPVNFSIFCLVGGADCDKCAHSFRTPLPLGYTSDYCGPRPTDNFVKAWGTSVISEADMAKFSDFYAPMNLDTGSINDDRIACENALYVCYNVNHGFCERLLLTDIRQIAPPPLVDGFDPPDQWAKNPGKIPVVGCDPSMHSALAIGSQYVYIASEPDGLEDFTLIPYHPLSARLRDFRLVNSQPGTENFVRLINDPNLRMQYKLAFRYHTLSNRSEHEFDLPAPAYIYFVLQQPESPSFHRWQPRIARMCDGDSQFFSYVELNVACQDCIRSEQEIFNAMHTAARGTAGRLLASQLQDKAQEQFGTLAETADVSEVLIVAFAPQPIDPLYYRAAEASVQSYSANDGHLPFSHQKDVDDAGAILLPGSALAVFSMAQIDAQFNRVIANCLDGRGALGPAHFVSLRGREHQHCIPDNFQKNKPYYCPEDDPLNRFIMGQSQDDTLDSPAFLHLPSNVTGLAVTAVAEEFTVAVFTTDDGWLYKYEIEALDKARKLAAFHLSPSGAPLTSLALDITGSVAFVTSPEKVFRIELYNCAIYTTCVACLGARDPYCGWCVIKGRCSLKEQCHLSNLNRLGTDPRQSAGEPVKDRCSAPKPANGGSTYPLFTWLSYKSSVDRCPLVKQVSPPGVQQIRGPFLHAGESATLENTRQQPIILTLNKTLATDLWLLQKLIKSSEHSDSQRLLALTSDHDSRPHIELSCAFRSAPLEVARSDALLSDSLSAEDINRLLVGIKPGDLIARTTAKLPGDVEYPLEVHCLSPPVHSLPSLPWDQASLPIVLWLEVSDNGHNESSPLAPGLFAVYDCTRLTDCRSCARSRFVCVWCLLEDRCVPMSSTMTTNGQLTDLTCTNSSGGSWNSDRKNLNQARSVVTAGRAIDCPRFKGNGHPITVMSGSTLTATFQVFNVQRPLKHFTCVEGCSFQRVVASYSPTESLVVCRIEKIDLAAKLNALNETEGFGGQSAAVNCSLDIYWHGQDSRSVEGHRMINEDNVLVEVYACGWLADHCDDCLNLPPRFGCGWCITSTSSSSSMTDGSYSSNSPRSLCTTRYQCPDSIKSSDFSTSTNWLKPGSVCPNPQILSLTPLNATLTGQPVLHVEGRNLGRRVEDIGSVYLEGPQRLSCSILSESYKRSRGFSCRLASAGHLTMPVTGRLKVVVSSHQYQAFSPNFHFLTPQLNEITPERGPVSGGTRLHLSGFNMNTGANRSVFLVRAPDKSGTYQVHPDRLGNAKLSVACTIERESNTLIVCRTSPLRMQEVLMLESDRLKKRATREETHQKSPVADSPPAPSASTLQSVPMSIVIMHDLTPTYPSKPYTFVYTPDPHIDSIHRANVLASGGTTIRIDGESLFVVEYPMIVFYFNRSEYTALCRYVDGSLECPSPSLCTLPEQAHHHRVSKYESSAVRTPNETGYFHDFVFDGTHSPSTLSEHLTHRTPILDDRIDELEMQFKDLVLLSLTKSSQDWPLNVAYGFIMDGVRSLRVYGLMKVQKDPVVSPFPDGIRVELLDDLDPSTNADEQSSSVNSVQKKRSPSDSASPSEEEHNSAPTALPLSRRAHQLLRIHGQFEALVAAPELASSDELVVRVGDSLICAVSSVITTEIRCDLDRQSLSSSEQYKVRVQFGQFLVYEPGLVQFVNGRQAGVPLVQIFSILAGIVILIVLVGLIAFALWRRFNRRQRSYQAKLDRRYAEHENRVVRIFKEDFMELQTRMQEFSQEVKKHNLPYREYRTFCLFSLFPEYQCELLEPTNPHTCGSCLNFPIGRVVDSMTCPATEQVPPLPPHPLLQPFTVPIESRDAASKGIALFHALICNRQFLCLAIRVIEEDERTTARDKSRVASLLCAALQPKMVYLTRIMCDLMAEMLERLHSQGDNRLPTAFRRAESVVDKIISNWLSFLLYNFIKNSVGENLFYFYRVLLQQLNMGPRDAVTGKARYTLDSSTLLLTELTGKPVSLVVEDPEWLFSFHSENVTVKVLDCDTISQAKEKILDAIYKNKPYSLQLKPTQLDLRKQPGNPKTTDLTDGISPGQIMCDWDIAVRKETGHTSDKPPFRLNCIRDYGLVDGDHVALVVCRHERSRLTTSSGSLHTFRSKKDTTNSTVPSVMSSPHLNSNSEATTFLGRTGTVQCPSGFGEYTAPHSVANGPRATGDVVPTLNAHLDHRYLIYSMRPTGPPDPALWYHLEWTGSNPDTSRTVNGGLCGSPFSGMIKKRPSKANMLDQTSSRGMTTFQCTCSDSQSDLGTGAHTNTNRNFAVARAFPCVHNRKPSRVPVHPDTMRMNDMRGDHIVHYPLLSCPDVCRPDKLRAGAYQDTTVNGSGVFKSLKKFKRKHKKGRTDLYPESKMQLTQASASLDRLMESLPKEVCFNRLLMTRLSVTKYMDKLFEVIFSSVVQSKSLPSPIKYLFDFLDDRAVRLGVQDPKTVHAWKSNCLQMRFWNQIITNLDYIFDIPLVRHTAFERSFHAFSQAMTYACAPNKETLTSDSSSVKLLFAPDINQQWTRVNNYYREIKAMPVNTREGMEDILNQHSLAHANEFNVTWAIYELYTKYVRPCHDAIVNRLQQEALKIAYPYKSQPLFPSNNAAHPDDVPPVDDFELSDWNPIQLIQMLNEVKRCMDSAATNTLLSHDAQSTDVQELSEQVSDARSTATQYATPFPRTVGTRSTSLFTGGGSSVRTFFSPQLSGTNHTYYPDTLRSLNTITTESAHDDESTRIALQQQQQQQQQHQQQYQTHHCYHVYGPNGTVLLDPRQDALQVQTNSGPLVLPPDQIQGCLSSLLPNSSG